MVKKRYQVFLSSTYEDLKDERFAVMESLQTMKCFVAGMEYFAAVDMNQFEYIKKTIDDCDYYLLVLGGRYGTVPDGEEKSYTEKEYDYAVLKNKPIIVLLHKDISQLASGKCEQSEIQKTRYAEFRKKLSHSRIVDFWRDVSELKAKALSGVVTAIENFPDVPGWMRGDSTASDELMNENYKLKKENNDLKNKIEIYLDQLKVSIDGLADLSDKIKFFVKYSYVSRNITYHNRLNIEPTLGDIFSSLSPFLLDIPSRNLLFEYFMGFVKQFLGKENSFNIEVGRDLFERLLIQFQALGLITVGRYETIKGGFDVFVALTEKGKKVMVENKVIKKVELS